MAATILKRINEEYEPTLKFLMATSEPPIGFWTSVRMIMPVVETSAKLGETTPPKLLEELNVPKPKIAWTMFRHGLSHGEIPFEIEDLDGQKYAWSISFSPRHDLTKVSNPTSITIGMPKLLADLKSYLEGFLDDEGKEISIQTGVRFEDKGTKAIKLYRFSPIKNESELREAIEHIHFACFELCKQSFDKYLPVAGNMGVFCHYDDEYESLIELRKQLTEASKNINQKYFKLHHPIVIPARGDVPETTYTFLYIRKPDPYRFHAGDVDFVLEEQRYQELKKSLQEGSQIKGARLFERQDLDMVELYDADVDVLGYVSPREMTEKVRVKQSVQ